MSEKEFKKGLKAHNRKDYKEAFAIFELLAEQRDAQAQYNIGVMYENGEGIPQNYGKALTWYRKAAEQGDAQAQYKCSGIERGVPENIIHSYMWLILAKANGYEKAQAGIKLLEDLLSSHSITEKVSIIDKAEVLAQKCWDSNYQNCPMLNKEAHYR